MNPHGTPWHVIEGVDVEVHQDYFADYSTLNWRGIGSVTNGMKKRIDYFYACFPMLELQGIVAATNLDLTGRGLPATSKAEILRMIGIRSTAALEKRRGGVRSWFQGGYEDDSVLRNGDYTNRFQMKVSRFEALTSCFQLREPP